MNKDIKDIKCFSRSCGKPEGGSGTDVELFASVARGAAIFGKYGKEKQIDDLATQVEKKIKDRHKQYRRLAMLMNGVTIVLTLGGAIWDIIGIKPNMQNETIGAIFQIAFAVFCCLFVLALLIVFFLIVFQIDAFERIILRFTFNSSFSISILKKGDISVDKLTVKDINEIIKKQHLDFIKDKDKDNKSRYEYKELTEEKLRKKGIKFKEANNY